VVPDITNQHGFYTDDQLAAAVHIASGLWVRLDDWCFGLAEIGHRYARVLAARIDERPVSFAYLDGDQNASYDLITSDMHPKILHSSHEPISTNPWLMDQLESWGYSLSPQQAILATIYAQEIGLRIGDQVAARRILSWVLTYEGRANWVCRHRQELFALGRAPDWRAVV